MKKVQLTALLAALVFGLGIVSCDNDEDASRQETSTNTGFGDEPDLFEDFEAYDVDTPISTADSDFTWKLWPNGIDGVITDEMALSGEKSLEVFSKVDDVILLEYDKGAVRIEFSMFIKEGKMGYYNYQAEYTEGDDANVWAFECYFYAGGVGALRVGREQVAQFAFTDNEWIKIVHNIDLDADTADMFVNDEEIFAWQYSIPQGGNGGGSVDGIDFYGVFDPPGTFYWADDVKVWESGT